MNAFQAQLGMCNPPGEGSKGGFATRDFRPFALGVKLAAPAREPDRGCPASKKGVGLLRTAGLDHDRIELVGTIECHGRER
jgi:hypothetical protein